MPAASLEYLDPAYTNPSVKLVANCERYLFQRPESMPRAVQKAGLELRRGAWLVSLEFEARTLQPDAVIACADGRTLWLYQQPFKPAG